MATMAQNQWVILQGDAFTLLPMSTDGSVSFTYAWGGDDLCGSNPWWTCAPGDVQVGQVQSGYNHNFGEGWFDKVNLSSVKEAVQIASDNFSNLYLRVTSGTVQIVPNVDVAPVPLPAAGILLPMALAALVAVRKARKSA